MADPTVIIVVDAKLLLGDTLAAVDPSAGTGEAFQCQVTSAALNANPNLQTVPATFCAPEGQAPAATGWELAVTWLQDWTAPGGGLSYYTFLNDTLTKFFSLTLNDSDTPVATGQARMVAGSYGGDAATPLVASQTWPVVGRPDITPVAAAPLSARTTAAPVAS